MTDPSILEDLKAYVDGELSPERAQVVADAIAKDPELKETTMFYETLSKEIRATGLTSEVRGRAEAIERIRNAPTAFDWSRFTRTLVAIGVVGVVASVMFPLFARNSSSTGPSADASVNMKAAAGTESAPSMDAPASTDGFTKSEGRADMAPGATGGGMPPALNPEKKNGWAESAESPSKPMNSAPEESKKLEAPASKAATRQAVRLVIRQAALSIRVPSTQAAVDTLTKRTEALKGYVAESAVDGSPDVQLTATMTLKVPEAHFESFLQEVRKMGDVLSSSATGNDVTLEYTDLQAKLKVMTAERDSLTKMMAERSNMEELVSLRERVMRLQAEIDGLTAQAQSLKSQASLSTITLSLTEPEKERAEQVLAAIPPQDPFASTWSSSVAGLTSMLQGIGKAGIMFVVYAPVWLPVTIMVWYLLRSRRRYA